MIWLYFISCFLLFFNILRNFVYYNISLKKIYNKGNIFITD